MTAAAAGDLRDRHGEGVMLALAGGFALSIGGVILRLIESADGWTVMFYRGVFFSLTVMLVLAVRRRGAFLASYRTLGWDGIAIAFCLGVGLIAYVFAMLLTTVANVNFVTGSSPLLTAFLAWVVLGERLSLRAWAILCLAMVGVGVMVVDGIAGGRFWGNVVALAAALTYAVFVILLRRRHGSDMLAATSLAGFIAAALSLPMVETLALTPRDFMLCALLGCVQTGLGFTFITFASRRIPAAEVTLLALTETVFGPVWAWLIAGEVPTWPTVSGGIVVLGCVAAYALVGLGRRPAAVPPPG